MAFETFQQLKIAKKQIHLAQGKGLLFCYFG